MFHGPVAKLAVLFVVTGAVLIVGPTVGVSSIVADRGFGVETTASPDAFVGLESVDESIDGRQDTATVARVHNNFGTEMSLTTSVSAGADLTIESGFDSVVAAGDHTSLTLACDGGGSSGTQTVVVTVDEASGTELIVEGATMTVDVAYQCTGGGGPSGQLEVRGVSTGASDSVVAFDVENTGSDAKIQRASVDSTSSSASEVDNGNEPEVQIGWQTVVDRPRNQGLRIGGTVYNGGQPVTIQAGDTVTVTVGEFRDETGVVDMEGETLEVTLYGSGGSPSYSLAGTVPVQVSNSGPIETDGDVVVETDGEVDGDVDSGGDVTTGDRGDVDGDVTADGNVETGTDTTIDGTVDAGADVSLGDRTTVDGTVQSRGDVALGNDGTIGGPIQASGDVSLGDRSSVDGAIVTDGDVVVGSDATVDGDVVAGGSVVLRDRAHVTGDIVAGSVTIYAGVDVDGDVDADGQCTDYSSRGYCG